MPKYVDFDQKIAHDIWDRVNVELSEFVPMRALREGIAIVGTVDIDCVHQITEECAVQHIFAGCELQIDPENEQFNLQSGLHVSPELRAVITVKISRQMSDDLTKAIEDCANWVEATAGAPDGFVGETYDENEAAPEEETLTAVVEPAAASASADCPYDD